MIVDLCAIIDNCHDIWIIVLIVIIKRVKENSQACPKIWAAEDRAIVQSFATGVPKCQTIRPYPSTSAYSKY